MSITEGEDRSECEKNSNVLKSDIADRQKKLFLGLPHDNNENVTAQVTVLIMKSHKKAFSTTRHGQVNKLNNLVKKAQKTKQEITDLSEEQLKKWG